MIARTRRFRHPRFSTETPLFSPSRNRATKNAIVHAALRPHVERSLAEVDPLQRLQFTASGQPCWTGDLQRGAFFNGDGCGNDDVVAWTETGVVGRAHELGFGALEQLRPILHACLPPSGAFKGWASRGPAHPRSPRSRHRDPHRSFGNDIDPRVWNRCGRAKAP